MTLPAWLTSWHFQPGSQNWVAGRLCNQTDFFKNRATFASHHYYHHIKMGPEATKLYLHECKEQTVLGLEKLSSIRDWTRLAHKNNENQEVQMNTLESFESMVGLAWSGGPWNEFCGCSCICGTCRWRDSPYVICHLEMWRVSSEGVNWIVCRVTKVRLASCQWVKTDAPQIRNLTYEPLISP